jgi:hypothetical protein
MTFAPASFVVSFLNKTVVDLSSVSRVFPPSPSVDWNRDTIIQDTPQSADINADGNITCVDLFDVDDHAIIASDMACGLPGNPHAAGC